MVDRRGAPVAGAEVLLGENLSSMADEDCDCPTCRERLLEDSCPAAEAKIAQLVGRREGEWLPDRSTRTDASGAFAFPGAPRRPHLLLWASAPGFSPAFRQRVLPEESAVLELGTPFSVAGRVVDEENHPIASALVTAIPSIVPRFVEATTGADGTFRIEGLGPGPLYLLASAPRYLPRGAPLPRPGPPALTLALARPRALEVVVKDRGVPALGASARLYSEHRIIPLAPAAGCFRAENLAPGAYMVSASRGARSAHRRVALGPGTTRVELSLDQGLSVRGRVLDDSAPGWRAPRSSPPSTAPAAEGSEVELVLRPQAFVSGVVLTADGAPALGVQVLARGDGRKGATTGAGGEFRIALGAPGPVTLVAHHSLHGAGELSLEAPAADVQLRLSPLGSLRARLVDRAHRPIAGGAATAFREPGGLRDALSSDSPSREDGVIALAGLSPGTYRVRFTADGFQSAERPGVAVPKTGEVDLGDVELEAGLEIHGVVLQDDGSPAAGAFVHARAKGRREAEGVAAGGDGTFGICSSGDTSCSIQSLGQR